MLTDLRLALRSLAKAPAFTLAAVVTLALGIGANTAIFSIVYSVLLKPLPFAEPDRLVSVIRMRRDVNLPARTSVTAFDEWRSVSTSLERYALYRDTRYTVAGHGEPEYVKASLVSDGFFATLGTSPQAGRVIGKADAEQPVVVLAWEFMRRRFGAGRAVGSTLVLDGKPHTVVGVMPPAFRFPSRDTAMWLPRLSVAGENRTVELPWYLVIARLKDSATLDQARAEAAVIGERIDARRGAAKDYDTQVRRVEDEMVGDVRAGLLILFAAVGVVLLVACINVGSLCLARAAVRRGDVAVRAALGASRWRLVRHLLAESVVLAAAGAAIGGLLAAWMLSASVRLVAPDTPRLSEVTISLPVLAFTMVVSALSVLLVGLVPAWHASRLSPAEVLSLNAGGARQSARTGRLRFVLIAAETALSTVVLIAALLFARSLGALLSVDSDRPTDHVLAIGLTLPSPAYADAYTNPVVRDRAVSLVGNVLGRVRRIEGIQSAAVTTSLPPDVAEMSFTLPSRNPATGQPEPYTYNPIIVGGDYFGLLGIAHLRGRLFDVRDTAGAAPVIVIGRDLARRRFGREDVVGEHMPIGPGAPATIVGVVDDVRYQGLHRPAGGALYLPYAQAATPTFYVTVRTAGPPWSVSRQVRDAVRAVDPRVPLAQPTTLSELRHASVAQPESRAVVLGGLAALALVLASVGLYGNSSYTTSQRTFEVGLRMALGAEGGSVVRMLVGGGLMPVALGLAVGLGGGVAVAHVVASLLFNVRPLDPVTFAGVPTLLLLVAVVAITIPALRATRVDPAITLGRRP
jgi:predicted permease